MISQLIAVLSIEALGSADESVDLAGLSGRYHVDTNAVDASTEIIKSSSVKSKVQEGLLSIVEKVEVDGVELNALYASISTASQDFHKNDIDKRERIITSSISGHGHTNCHNNCHNNRGWR